ncbi:hypothetical protein ACR6HW_08230 [Fusibacter sp. JL298sf-3]
MRIQRPSYRAIPSGRTQRRSQPKRSTPSRTRTQSRSPSRPATRTTRTSKSSASSRVRQAVQSAKKHLTKAKHASSKARATVSAKVKSKVNRAPSSVTRRVATAKTSTQSSRSAAARAAVARKHQAVPSPSKKATFSIVKQVASKAKRVASSTRKSPPRAHSTARVTSAQMAAQRRQAKKNAASVGSAVSTVSKFVTQKLKKGSATASPVSKPKPKPKPKPSTGHTTSRRSHGTGRVTSAQVAAERRLAKKNAARVERAVSTVSKFVSQKLKKGSATASPVSRPKPKPSTGHATSGGSHGTGRVTSAQVVAQRRLAKQNAAKAQKAIGQVFNAVTEKLNHKSDRPVVTPTQRPQASAAQRRGEKRLLAQSKNSLAKAAYVATQVLSGKQPPEPVAESKQDNSADMALERLFSRTQRTLLRGGRAVTEAVVQLERRQVSTRPTPQQKARAKVFEPVLSKLVPFAQKIHSAYTKKQRPIYNGRYGRAALDVYTQSLSPLKSPQVMKLEAQKKAWKEQVVAFSEPYFSGGKGTVRLFGNEFRLDKYDHMIKVNRTGETLFHMDAAYAESGDPAIILYDKDQLKQGVYTESEKGGLKVEEAPEKKGFLESVVDKVESHITQMAYDSMDFSQGVGDAISETLLEQVVETGSFLQAAITVKPYSETYEKNSGIVEGNKENHRLMAEASVRDPRIYGLGHLYGNVAIMTKGVVEVIRGAGTAVGGVALTGGSLVATGATGGAAAPAVAVSWGAVGVGGGLIVDGALSVGNGYENSKESIRLIQNAGGGRGEGVGNSSRLTPKQLNQYRDQVISGNDIHFKTKDEALDFINKKFPDFAEEVAGARSSEGWHFDSHPIGGSKEAIDHINIYSKRQKFRIHITWGD